MWNKLITGDKIAFDKIYYRYISVLYNYGRRFTRNKELVDDCIQELFTNLWVKRNNLGSTNSIKPYLLVSLKRRILRQLSIERKSVSFDQLNDFRLEYSVEKRIIEEDRQAISVSRMNQNLAKLTPKQREVIHLKFYEQLSYVEIAQVMQVEVKAIYKLMARAINSLRADFITMAMFIICRL